MKLKHSLEALNQKLEGPPAPRPGPCSGPPRVTHQPPAPFTATRPASWSVFSDEDAAASTSTHPAAPRVGLEVSQRVPARLPEGGMRFFDEHRPAPHPVLKQSRPGAGGPLAEAAPLGPSARPRLPCGAPTSTRSFLYGPHQADGWAAGRSPLDRLVAGGQQQQHYAQER